MSLFTRPARSVPTASLSPLLRFAFTVVSSSTSSSVLSRLVSAPNPFLSASFSLACLLPLSLAQAISLSVTTLAVLIVCIVKRDVRRVLSKISLDGYLL